MVPEVIEDADIGTSDRERRIYRAEGRKKQKASTRSRIIASALKRFSESGFEAATVRDIALDAGVTHAAIRLHFGSKDELWRVAINQLFEWQSEAFRSVDLDEARPLTADLVREGIRRYVRYCAQHPEHVRIMVHETVHDGERLRWLVDHQIRPRQAPLARLLARAMTEGLLIDIPLPSLLVTLTSASQMIFALGAEAKHLHGIDVTDPTLVDRHADALAALVLRSSRS